MTSENILKVAPFLKVREGGKDSWASFNVEPERLLEAVEILRREFAVDSLADLAAIDMGEDCAERFGVVYHFYSHSRKGYVRLVAMCKSSAKPVLPTLSNVFNNANWFEREAFDMMGIVFDGHRDLRRILMWDAYCWNPLRKDFPLAGREAPLPDTYEDAVGDDPMFVVPAPMEGGPFASKAGAKFTACKEPRSREKI